MVSARPDQRLARADSDRVRAAPREGTVAVVVDDPPDSGTAVARVCAELTRLGMPPGSVVATLALFDESLRPPKALSPYASGTLPWSGWSIHRRLSPERTAQRLASALPAATVRVDRELPVAAGLPRSTPGGCTGSRSPTATGARRSGRSWPPAPGSASTGSTSSSPQPSGSACPR